MRLNRPVLAILSVAAAALPLAALAHGGLGMARYGTNFLLGFSHPLEGLDHLAAMVAVGLWSALLARRSRDLLWTPIGFAGMLLIGTLLGLTGVPQVPGVEPMIAASLLVIGLIVATKMRLPGPVAAALVGVFALFHGVAHGYELVGNANAVSAIAGMVLATALLHCAGIAIGWKLSQRSAWLARAAGAAVALFGLALVSQIA